MAAVTRPAFAALGRPSRRPCAYAEEAPMTAAAITGVGQVALYVRDADRATTFYRDTLGLTHLYTFGDLVFFDCAGLRLYLHQLAEDEWRPGSVLYFTVDDITTAHQRLISAGVAFDAVPHLIHRHDSGIEEWMAFFSDSEGNTLALMSRIPPSPSQEAAEHPTS